MVNGTQNVLEAARKHGVKKLAVASTASVYGDPSYLPMDEIRSNGYCFQIEMAHRAWQEGFRVVEIPITFTERASGVSKMSKQIVAEALGRVAVWALTGGRRRHRPHHPASVAPDASDA